VVLVAVILIALLALFRWRKKRRDFNDAGHQRRSSGIPDEKDSMDFADKGYPQVSSARQYLGHEPQSSQGSFSSMAILMGRYGHKRGGDKGMGVLGSDSSSQFNKKYKTAISKPIPQEQPMAMRAGPARQEKGVSFGAAEEPAPTNKPRGSTRGGKKWKHEEIVWMEQVLVGWKCDEYSRIWLETDNIRRFRSKFRLTILRSKATQPDHSGFSSTNAAEA
jgi:hypothetical protein